MSGSSVLPLVTPWRMFFNNTQVIETDSAFYKALTQAYLSRNDKQLSGEFYDYWGASQDTELFQLVIDEGEGIQAGYQIIATFDGSSVLWADENPSIRDNMTEDARRFREIAQAKGYAFASERKLNAGARDAIALLALAAQELESHSSFAGQSGNALVLMTLYNIEEALFGGESFKAPLAEHDPSPLSIFQKLIDKQVAELQPNDKDLHYAETKLSKAYIAYQVGDFANSVNITSELRDHLEPHFLDKEPSGWMLLCEGSSHLALGNREKAAEAFDLASRCILPYDPVTRFIGQFRTSDKLEDQQSNLFAAYIRNPDRFVAVAIYEEKSGIASALEQAMKKRTNDEQNPKETWIEALTEYRDLQVKAYNWDKEAAKFRTESHILCDEDMDVRKKIDAAYRNFCLTWTTPGRNTRLASYGNPPSHCPDLEKITDVTFLDESNCIIKTERNEHGYSTYHRYELKKSLSPLAPKPLWLIDKVWSVWDDEEILLWD